MREQVADQVRLALLYTNAYYEPIVVHGPTAGPAMRAFWAAWNPELETIRGAAEQLAVALEIAAGNYDSTDHDQGNGLDEYRSHFHAI